MLATRSPSTDYNGIGSAILAVTVLGLSLSGLAVGLRVGARRIKHVPLGIDDWLIILGTISYFGYCANAVVCVYTLGGGQVDHDGRDTHRKYIQYMQSLYASSPLYIITATPIKLSVCLLYCRLFSVQYFRRTIQITIALCLLWFVTGVITTISYCRPIHYFWDKSVDGGHCFQFFAHFAVFGVASVVIDTVIIAISIAAAVGLNMSLRKRVVMAAAFLLSTFMLVSGTLRIVYSSLDDAPRELLCSIINLGISSICASLPTYPALFVKLGELFTILHSQLTDSRHDKTSMNNTGLSGHTRSIYRSRGEHQLAMNRATRDIHPMTRISIDNLEGEGSGIMIRKEIGFGY